MNGFAVPAPEGTSLSPAALLGFARLTSTALPVGAFAYSQGLERAVVDGAVRDRESAERWVCGLLRESVIPGDVPLVALLYAAWLANDVAEARRLNGVLYATRGSRELRDEERQLGTALSRLLSRLGSARAAAWLGEPRLTFGGAFALAAVDWGLSAEAASLGYCFTWVEAQAGALSRLVPLGQTDVQLVLASALQIIAERVPAAARGSELDAHATAPGQAQLSAWHETQYSRLFRS